MFCIISYVIILVSILRGPLYSLSLSLSILLHDLFLFMKTQKITKIDWTLLKTFFLFWKQGSKSYDTVVKIVVIYQRHFIGLIYPYILISENV